MSSVYNHKQCQSLFGYAFETHVRSGGVCQLCHCGGDALTFDLWRQLTVEHLIGKKQGGYRKEIRAAVADRFPTLSSVEQETLVRTIEAMNTVTACSFCNSTTSQDACAWSMRELLFATAGEPAVVLKALEEALKSILERKRNTVSWKLESVRRAYERSVVPALRRHAADAR